MTWIPGGTYLMGSDRHYPEERPAHPVTVPGFWIDRTPVTNDMFAAFVAATGHVTLAETVPTIDDYPEADPASLVAGSLVFVPPESPVPLDDITRWWRYVPGATWRTPTGPDSDIDGLGAHPVVHVAHGDAQAYAAWAGAALPSEAEWEFAARGGLDGATFAWGEEFKPGGRRMANTWQGRFPWERTNGTVFDRTTAVGTFAPNGYGLVDMIGNVWEWTDDPYRDDHAPTRGCCAPPAHDRVPRKVIKGGSHLCAPNYCRRYRPAARYPEPIDTSTTHLGFRCVRRVTSPD
jgi:formylglycine-generating enzyme required for sulfatase activity